MTIRPEQPGDEAAVREILLRAFDGPAEAALVDRLRSAGAATVALVAEVEGVVVGHILFSPVEIEAWPQPQTQTQTQTKAQTQPRTEAKPRTEIGGVDSRVRGVGLAPMAVLPDHQRSGIGSELVREGLARCRELGELRVVVPGHPEYYPRFGFVPASTFGIRSDYDVPDEVFMAQELEQGALEGVSGIAHYRAEFEEL